MISNGSRHELQAHGLERYSAVSRERSMVLEEQTRGCDDTS